MKYVCTICGYVYDEEEQGASFESLPNDWKCPLCGAPKSMFEKQSDGDLEPKQEGFSQEDDDEELVSLGVGELSAVFSNLARGCEKQYQDEAKALFDELASYFEGLAPKESDCDVDSLARLIKKDLDEEYKALRARAEKYGDRGSLRAITWGEKVTKIAQSLIESYKAQGDSFLESTSIFVCTVCGFIYVGDNPPELCPVCKVPSWKFEEIKGRA